MKVVDLNAEINRTCQAVCGCNRKDCKWTRFGPKYRPEEACTVIQRLEEAQSIEAIPVEWLYNHAKGIENPYPVIIEDAIEEWTKEQEAKV